ncbi:hypothetical protein OAG71_02565, partial [bacterium]|nr:hypothetical protein [bacterium]
VDKWNTKQENTRKLTADTAKANSENLSKVIGIAARMTAVAGAAVAVYTAVLSWTREITGFNRGLTKAIKLEQDLAKARRERDDQRRQEAQDGVGDAADRENLRNENVGKAVNAEDSETRKLDLIKEQLRIQKEIDKLTTAKFGLASLLKQRLNASAVSNRSNQIDEIEIEIAAIDRRIKAEKESIELNKKAIELSKKKEAGLTDEQIAEAKRLADAQSLADEELQRAKGNVNDADKIRDERERGGLVDQFGEEEGNALADKKEEAELEKDITKAQQEAFENWEFANEARKKAAKEQERIDKQIGEDALRQIDKEIKAREKQANEREAFEEALSRLGGRKDEIIKDRANPIGGFELGFQQLSNRINNAASKTNGTDNKLEKINAEIRDKTKEQNNKLDKHQPAVEKKLDAMIDAIKGIDTGGLA